jgi:hypothetical protein
MQIRTLVLSHLGALLSLLFGLLDAYELVSVQSDDSGHRPTVSGCLIEFFSNLRKIKIIFFLQRDGDTYPSIAQERVAFSQRVHIKMRIFGHLREIVTVVN